MDQVIVLMEKYLTDSSTNENKIITSSMINNYVKLGIMPAPIKKKYSREHLAYLIIIGSLKQAMPISHIKNILEKKLKQNTIDKILDSYSDLYSDTFKKLLRICFERESNDENIDDTLLFTSIAAANCINISNQIFYMNYGQTNKNK